MPIINDEEFGEITLRRSTKASSVRIRLAPNGQLRVSSPVYAPIFLVKRFINSSRPKLRELLNEHHQSSMQLANGMQIGKSHTLVIRESSVKTSASRHGQQIIVQLNENDSLSDNHVVVAVRKAIIDALRIEAKSYLPKRLSFLAQKEDFTYQKVRFSHASGRWGSCSTNGTISLNIALMKLPFELIDYV
ncbi:MAG: YgjP-like metallopeptidase domain-containing protein, partial [Candidatus Saccharibacteria bacterium]